MAFLNEICKLGLVLGRIKFFSVLVAGRNVQVLNYLARLRNQFWFCRNSSFSNSGQSIHHKNPSLAMNQMDYSHSQGILSESFKLTAAFMRLLINFYQRTNTQVIDFNPKVKKSRDLIHYL